MHAREIREKMRKNEEKRKKERKRLDINNKKALEKQFTSFGSTFFSSSFDHFQK